MGTGRRHRQRSPTVRSRNRLQHCQPQLRQIQAHNGSVRGQRGSRLDLFSLVFSARDQIPSYEVEGTKREVNENTMVVLALSGDKLQFSLINPNVPQRLLLTWTGTYVATVAETTVDVFEVSPYRSITVATRASGGGAASVVIKIYACDSTGAVP